MDVHTGYGPDGLTGLPDSSFVRIPTSGSRRKAILFVGSIMPFTILLGLPTAVDVWEKVDGETEHRKPIVVTILMAISMCLAVAENIALYFRFMAKNVIAMTIFTLAASALRGTYLF
jgi:multisubunit Na+/H+ antiporter MnhG subunit